MEPADLVTRLSAHERRRSGSDAERRATLVLAAELGELGGRSVRVHLQTRWLRPGGAAVAASLAALGVVGSVVATSDALVGLGLALLALVLLTGEVTGRAQVLRLMIPRRATQDVEARDRRTDVPVRLVITAPVDVPPTSLLDAGPLPRLGGRLRRRTRGRLPGPLGWLVLGLCAIAATAGARVAGADGLLVGALQLVPTVAALVLATLLLDRALARTPAPGANANASGVAAALALAGRLRAAPPHALAVDVVLTGASEPDGAGFAAWLRERRRDGLGAAAVAVLAFGPSGAGTPVWLAREGLVRTRRPHPQLRALAERLGPERGARGHVARTASGARIAQGRGWPGLALGAVDGAGVAPHRGTDGDVAALVEPAALGAVVDLAEAIVRGLDAQLAPARAAPPPTSARAARRAAR